MGKPNPWGEAFREMLTLLGRHGLKILVAFCMFVQLGGALAGDWNSFVHWMAILFFVNFIGDLMIDPLRIELDRLTSEQFDKHSEWLTHLSGRTQALEDRANNTPLGLACGQGERP